MSQKTLPVRHKSFVQGLSHPRTCSKEMRNFLKWPEVSPATSFSKSLLKTSRKEGKRKKKRLQSNYSKQIIAGIRNCYQRTDPKWCWSVNNMLTRNLNVANGESSVSFFFSTTYHIIRCGSLLPHVEYTFSPVMALFKKCSPYEQL